MKYWRLSLHEVLWGMSHLNMMMLSLSIPEFDEKGNKKQAPAMVTGNDLKSRFKKLSK